MAVNADIVAFRFDEEAMVRLLRTDPFARDLARRAIRVESAAKNYATGVDGGPNVRSGRLRSSITWRIGEDQESLYADVGSNVEYAIYVEKGTRFMAARPFLEPALQAAE